MSIWVQAKVKYNHYDSEMKVPSVFKTYISDDFKDSEEEILTLVIIDFMG